MGGLHHPPKYFTQVILQRVARAIDRAGRGGQQGGDPAKLANALVQLAGQDEPPLRFRAGADAIATVEQKAKDLLAQADAYRELSSNLAHDDA